jgi:hypothetical protein
MCLYRYKYRYVSYFYGPHLLSIFDQSIYPCLPFMPMSNVRVYTAISMFLLVCTFIFKFSYVPSSLCLSIPVWLYLYKYYMPVSISRSVYIVFPP